MMKIPPMTPEMIEGVSVTLIIILATFIIAGIIVNLMREAEELKFEEQTDEVMEIVNERNY